MIELNKYPTIIISMGTIIRNIQINLGFNTLRNITFAEKKEQ